MGDSVGITVRKATIEDAKEITKIVDSVLLKNLKDTKNGFLSGNLGEEKYSNFIRKSEYCYVAVAQKIVGFLIAYPSGMIKPDYDIHKYLYENHSDENFVYIFQVGVLPQFQRKTVAKQLYRDLFDDTVGIKKMVVSSAEPYNEASERFHLNMGFKKIDEIQRDDGGTTFVYEKK